MKEESKSPLQQLSESLSQTVQDVGPSVVRVEARRRGHASGVVWSSEERLIVTAHHAVERDHDIRIGLPDGEIVEAELVGRDPSTDLALLRARDGDVVRAPWASAGALRVGHLVLSVGRHDRHAQASLGIVSKLDEAWRTSAGGKLDAYIQTDIPVYPGFSGSALVDADGHVVGLNSSWLRRRLPLTAPLATLERVLGHLSQHGHMRRGYLGVGAYPVRLPADLARELDQRSGLLIISVEEGSPAQSAGVFVGDLFVGLEDEPLRQLDDLLALLSEDRIGTGITIKTIRAGKLTQLDVKVGAREDS